MEYHLNGNIAKEVWMVNGLEHREDGPAYMEYNKNGKIIKKKYYWKNRNITDIVKKLFRHIPKQLNKNKSVLLKLSLPEKYLT